MIDAVAYAIWSIFWFASFCVMIHGWHEVRSDERDFIIKVTYGQPTLNNIYAAIVFTSFSVVLWVSEIMKRFLAKNNLFAYRGL